MRHVKYTRSQAGFTLIELMIVVAIIAILAAVAWNFYDDQAAKNRRTDAIIAISKAKLAMQQWRSDFATFDGGGNATGTAALNAYRANAPGSAAGSNPTDCLHNRGYMVGGGGGFISCRGYYNIVIAATPETYTITVADIGQFNGTNQEDKRCKTFTLTNTGVHGVNMTGVDTGLTGSETMADRTRECWAQ